MSDPSPARLSRRTLLSLLVASPTLFAFERRPYGGTLRLELPVAVGELDPHAGGDLLSALFGPAVADPLFAWDPQGRPHPALAASLPLPSRAGARVTLRPGLVSARGRSLDARDVVHSMERARRSAGRAVLSGFGRPEADRDDPLTVVFPGADAEALAEALASPVTAIVPRTSTARAPDGTGAFRATPAKELLVLERNERAARGPAYLDRIEVRAVPDLASALRSFESGDADVGFLGAGLHRRREGSVDFRAAPSGQVVLRTGEEARAWGAPGVAARLADAVDPARLAPLGLTKRAGTDPAGWGGAAGDLLVDASAPLLVEVARVVAGALSRPGHELRATPLPRGELRTRLDAKRFTLAVEFVRRIGETPRHGLLALLASVDPRLLEKPPDPSLPPESVLRSLPLGLLGEFAVSGARASDVLGLETWDLGSVFREKA